MPIQPTASDAYEEMLQSRLASRHLRDLPSHAIRAVRLLLQVAKRPFVLVLLLQAASAVGTAAQILLAKTTLDGLLAGTARGDLLINLLLIVIINAVISIAGAAQTQLQALLGELIVNNTWTRVLKVAAAVPLATFDDNEYFERLQRIRSNALVRPLQICQGAISLMSGLLASVSALVALALLQPILAPLVICAAIPLFWLAKSGGNQEYRFALKTTRNLRERFSLIELMTDRSSAAEVRAFALFEWLFARYLSLYSSYLAMFRAKVWTRLRAAITTTILSSVLLAAALALVVNLLGRGALTLPQAGAALLAVILVAGRMRQLSDGVASILEATLFIQDLSEFEASVVTSPVAPARATVSFNELRLEHVSYVYPGAAREALTDVTLTVRRGETIAVVGANGSGKTTLSKILANLYAPTSGAVRWNDRDVRELGRDEVARSTAVLFQDFVRYEMTLRENILLGDHRANEEKLQRIPEAALLAGVAPLLAVLDEGYEAMLSPRLPGGTDLSAGQWQRVAMARLLFRDAPLVILDEPTASLDPKAEEDQYTAMSKILSGRTVILVTHRLASARRADRIVVLEKGRVIEQGSHADLIALGRTYKEMFDLQARSFRDS